MDIEKIFHMTGGLGETSYSRNSSLQKKASDKVKHITLETIQQVYKDTTPTSIGIADLGCSSGPNTLSTIKDILHAVVVACNNNIKGKLLPEFRVYLNDLPTNDFNAIFQTLPEFYRDLKKEKGNPSVFVAASPGTFYGRLFPMKSLHFIYASYSLHWLSREEQLSILRNKPEGTILTLEDLNNMSYASKVVKETLRMSNVLLWFPRVALDNCTVNGIEIKKGWHVNIDATYIHYDPETYKEPFLFNPSRFDEMQKPYSYIPFGSGPRTCLGMNMAKVTMLVFLHRLTSGYKWTVDDLDPSLEKKAHIPRLQSGCPITLTAL